MAKTKISKKDCIMEQAKLLFSKKGYDAAGMDEIATLAGVPKSLIYYHFKNKEDLLRKIINGFIAEYEQIIQFSVKGEIGTERYFDFLYENKDFLKIIVVESLKSNGNALQIFEVVQKLIHDTSDNDGDLNCLQTQTRQIAEFFLSIVPFALFTCYIDDWCQHFNTDIEAAKTNFITVYNQTHGAYHAAMEN